jgi:hypothetical protein
MKAHPAVVGRVLGLGDDDGPSPPIVRLHGGLLEARHAFEANPARTFTVLPPDDVLRVGVRPAQALVCDPGHKPLPIGVLARLLQGSPMAWMAASQGPLW